MIRFLDTFRLRRRQQVTDVRRTQSSHNRQQTIPDSRSARFTELQPAGSPKVYSSQLAESSRALNTQQPPGRATHRSSGLQKLTQHFPLWALWISGAITFLAATLLVLAVVLGVRAGQQQLELKRRQQISLILQQALEYHNAGQVEAARIAYEEVLLLDTDNVAAVDGLSHLRSLGSDRLASSAAVPQAVVPTATAITVATATTPATSATNRPAPTRAPPTARPTQRSVTTGADSSGTVISREAKTAMFENAEDAFQAGRWSAAIDQLLRLRASDAAYQQESVSELLFEAYVNLATEKDNQNKFAEAVALLDKALAIQPNATLIRTERTLINYYMDAITYVGADWARAIEALEAIYALESGYRDVKVRLQEALRAQSEQLANADEWCDAAQLLTESIDIGITPGVIATRDEYQDACENGVIAEEEEADETPPAETAPSPTGSSGATTTAGAGTIIYSAIDATSGQNRILAQTIGETTPTVLRENATQPAFRQDGQRLLYRNLRNDMAGLSAWDPASDLLLRFTTYAEDTLPSWNPQSNRIVFASNREGDRIWRVYLAWAESESKATVLSIGEAPAWHPSADRIAFRGCDNTGNRCGLWRINSSGAERVPVTDIPNDNRPAWAPNGQTIVFMSNGRDGNFEIYRVDVESGQVRRLTNQPALDALPTVSPDGSTVAFVSNRDGRWQIWVVPIGGGTPTVIAPIVGNLGSWTEQGLQWVP